MPAPAPGAMQAAPGVRTSKQPLSCFSYGAWREKKL
ncbi:hypothetical protein A2U01_0118074, partial [Trifolium medium]|nr:hypothetical protein [Trifolium medium]